MGCFSRFGHGLWQAWLPVFVIFCLNVHESAHGDYALYRVHAIPVSGRLDPDLLWSSLYSLNETSTVLAIWALLISGA